MRQEYWDKLFDSGRVYRPLNRFFLKKLLSNLPFPPQSVADLGCGTGGDLLTLASFSPKTVGVDYSNVALEKARAMVSATPLSTRITLFKKDLNELTPCDFVDRPFDLILSKYCFAFLDDPENFLRVTSGILSPSGILVLMTPVVCFGEQYADERMKKISVDFRETMRQLKDRFSTVTIFHQQYEGLEEVDVTFMAGGPGGS